MANPMRIRANTKDGVTEIRVLMSHEMETGQRHGAAGAVVPAWFITEVTATLNGRKVMQAQWGPSIAKNPYYAFKVKGGAVGDKVSITWVDNRGDTRTDEAVVA
jgi:sulfur-oxidizing protein SoxZ